MWSEIGSQGDLSKIVDTGCIDNGAAIEWRQSIAAGSCVTLTSASSFGPVPSIAQFSVGSVTPNQGTAGQTLTVVISGIGFQSGTTFNFGPGITVNSTTINSSTQATVSITIANNATAGPRDVSGTQSPGGLTATSPSAFTVIASTAGGADLAVTKTGPATVPPNGTVVYTVTVTNNGPATATNVQLSDPTPTGLTLLSAGSCTSFPCALGTMSAGQSITVQPRYSVQSNAPSPIINTATVSSSTSDPNSVNNSASTNTFTCPTSAPTITTPANGATNVATSGTLSWNSVGAPAYNVYLGVAGTGCSRLIATRSATSLPYAGLDPSTTYEWRVETVATGCAPKSTGCLQFTTSCPTQPPTLLSPLSGTLNTETTFSWTPVPGATEYHLFVSAPSFGSREIGKTTGTSLKVTPPDGSITWYVVATFSNGCPSLQSESTGVVVCTGAESPIASVVAEATTGQTYTVQWNLVSGAARYEVDEALLESFSGATTQSVTGTSLTFQHTVTSATAYFYRVRAFSSCAGRLSGNSPTIRAVVIPVPPLGVFNPNVAIPVGSKQSVVQQVFLPGFPGQTLPFTATVDKPWLQVSPQSGMLPPEGVLLSVTSDPTALQNGTLTGTVLVSVGSGSKIIANALTPVSIPVSINLVTPVTPVTRKTPPASALIIPTVGNVEGVNSRWQSDVFIANTSSGNQLYDLVFIPGGDNSAFVKQTTLQVDAGSTLALVDIVRNWYGIGSLDDRANGILEVIPRDLSGKTGPDAVNVALTTFVSSKTYNLSANGTLPQFVPAIPFTNLIGKPIDATKPTILGLQQIAQSDQAHTNLGLVEAAAQPVSVLVSAFDSSGSKLLDEAPFDLRANEQRQINSFLAQNNISVTDGRIEVKVTSGEGSVAAYASVVDSKSGDPLLVAGTPLGQTNSDHYILPGVADLNNGFANWRTDARVFNSGSTSQSATLTFYPQNNSGPPQSASLTINPGEVKRLDNLLQSLFGAANVGGAMQITTPSPAPLVVTARTYNQTSTGTLGQFIPAVTTNDAVGANDRALQILQLEDSARFRANLGVAEVTGKPARVEVSLVLPDSKVSPRTEVPLGANEVRQFGVIRDFGLSNVYNARVAVRVISGDGKITAYGSVIDQKTQAPAYVPAQ